MNEQIQQFQISAGSLSNHFEQQSREQLKFLGVNYLTLNDRKISSHQTEIHQPDLWPFDDNIGLEGHICDSCRRQERNLKNKVINKVQRIDLPKKEASPSFRKQIKQLKERIQQLEKQIFTLQRNQHSCAACLNKLPDYYRAKFEESIMQPQDYEINDAGVFRERRRSRDSLQFQQIDFHMPLMQTTQMEEKMWVFLGTMLIAMGSKVMDFDGNINAFKIRKNSVDNIRKQVQKCQEAVSMQFFCYKQELKEQTYIDGMNFDPFYHQNDNVKNQLQLDGVSLESVEDYQLVYDFKYNFNIKYHSLITLMQYAKQHCCIS